MDNIGRNALANAVVGGVFEAVRLLVHTGQFNPHEIHEGPTGSFPSVQLALFLAQDPKQDKKGERNGIRELLIRI